MSGSQWKRAWENGQTDFQQPQVNVMLKACLPGLDLAEGARILVPVHGENRDMT